MVGHYQPKVLAKPLNKLGSRVLVCLSARLHKHYLTVLIKFRCFCVQRSRSLKCFLTVTPERIEIELSNCCHFVSDDWLFNVWTSKVKGQGHWEDKHNFWTSRIDIDRSNWCYFVTNSVITWPKLPDSAVHVSDIRWLQFVLFFAIVLNWKSHLGMSRQTLMC